MSPWEVIQDALLHKRPVRNQQWLAEQLGVSIQVVNNWKARGVPARRYRDIAAALGITIDQIEGMEPLPWLAKQEQAADFSLSPEVAKVAEALSQLRPEQLKWALDHMEPVLATAKLIAAPTEKHVDRFTDERGMSHDAASAKRRVSR